MWLNYHHLLYFWTVARTGSVAAACEELHVSQPTISAQLKTLQQNLGQDLFERRGRRLELTEAGRLVYRYADDIFSLGRELLDVLQGRPAGHALQLHVGVVDVLPKLVVFRLLQPTYTQPEPIQMICQEGPPADLFAKLSVHDLDVVLADMPVGPPFSVRAFNHLLGECGVTAFAPRSQAGKYRRRFPQSLDNAPFLLPRVDTALRRSLDRYFDQHEIRPQVAGEFDDSALIKVFAQSGVGLFAAPDIITQEIQRQYDLAAVGQLAGVREQFYAITVERKVTHPAVQLIARAARDRLFESRANTTADT